MDCFESLFKTQAREEAQALSLLRRKKERKKEELSDGEGKENPRFVFSTLPLSASSVDPSTARNEVDESLMTPHQQNGIFSENLLFVDSRLFRGKL